MVLLPDPRDPQSDRASLERDPQRLDTDLRQLTLDYTMFFAGQRPRPPIESRARVEESYGAGTGCQYKRRQSGSGTTRSNNGFGRSLICGIAGCAHGKKGVRVRSRVFREPVVSVECSMPGSVAWPSSTVREPHS
jgi:hypothetical protein